MRRRLIVFSALALGLLVAAGPLVAHHGFFGVLDLTGPILFEGVVTNVKWTNPHIVFNLDVRDQDGKVTNWRFEGAGPGALKLRGWDRTDLRIGDRITVEGYRAKDGSFVAGAAAVMLANGRTLDASSDGVPSFGIHQGK